MWGGVGWAGIALQKEDQLGRKSLGRNQKEKGTVPHPHNLLGLLCGTRLLQDPGSGLEPALPLWELGFRMDFTSQVFLFQCQGNFYTLEWLFGPSQWKCHRPELGWAEPPQSPDTSSQTVNSTGNNFSTLSPSFFQGEWCFFSGSDPPEHIPIPKPRGQQHLWGLFSSPGSRMLC